MKHHPPHHHREICAIYLYMENAILKINHKGAIMSYVRTDRKNHNCNVDHITGRHVEGCLVIQKKDSQTQIRSPNKLKTVLTRGILSYHPQERRSDTNISPKKTKDKNNTWKTIVLSVIKTFRRDNVLQTD